MLGPATTLSRYSGWTTKMTAFLHLQWRRSRMPGDLPPFPILHSIRTTSLYNGSKINTDTTDWTHRSEMKWKTYLKTIIWMWLSVVTTGIKVSVFWDLKPCRLVFARVCQHLEAICTFRLQGTLGTSHSSSSTLSLLIFSMYFGHSKIINSSKATGSYIHRHKQAYFCIYSRSFW